MVVSYEMLVRCIEDIERMDFGIIVCDEGHRLKNAGNKTSSVIKHSLTICHPFFVVV